MENTTTCGSHDHVGSVISHQVERFTDLPDCVTSNILSRLPELEIARTCVLSKSWKCKWPFICYVNIDSICDVKMCQDSSRLESFYSLLDKILEFNCDLRVSSFRLEDKSHNDQKSTFSNIVNRCVRRLWIEGSSRERKINLRRLDRLTELELLFDRTLNIDVENCFSRLKSLYLNGNDGAIVGILNVQSPNRGYLLLSFPVLKSLMLYRFKFLNVKFVEINAPILNCFEVVYPYNANDYVIKLCAPKLYRFESSGCHLNNFDLYSPSLRFMNLESQFVPCEVGEIFALRTMALLRKAQSLKLSPSIVEALAEWKGVYGLTSFDRLKQLDLYCSSAKDLSLLHAIPYLESLRLHAFSYSYEQLQGPLPPCIVSQLKVVEFDGGSVQIGLAKLFLEKAKELKKLFISFCEVGVETYDEIRHWLTLKPEISSRVSIDMVFN